MVPITAPIAEASCVYSLANFCGVSRDSSIAQLGAHCSDPHVPRSATPASIAPCKSRRLSVATSLARISPAAIARERYMSTG